MYGYMEINSLWGSSTLAALSDFAIVREFTGMRLGYANNKSNNVKFLLILKIREINLFCCKLPLFMNW